MSSKSKKKNELRTFQLIRPQQLSARPKGQIEDDSEAADENVSADQQDSDLGKPHNDDSAAGEVDGEEVYVVESILDHAVDEDGELRFLIKWQDWDREEDQTWEGEENLANAQEILRPYIKKHGGREMMHQQALEKASKKKKEAASHKRKRERVSTATTTGSRSTRSVSKRVKHGHSGNITPPLDPEEWQPPSGSWEDGIADLSVTRSEDTGELMVWLTWKNGHRNLVPTTTAHKRCPQMLINYYEKHLRVLNTEDYDKDLEEVAESDV